jgi:ribonuclease HI
MASRKYTCIYTDGGKEMWAFVVARGGKIVHEESGFFGLSASTSNDDTESEAILRALNYAKAHPDNYLVTTDSQAMIGKISGSVINANKNPNIPGIRSLLKEINESPGPVSAALKWEKRLANDFMKRADALCRQQAAKEPAG